MKATKLTCQGCGADLPVAEGEKVVRCEYCGASNTLGEADGGKKDKVKKVEVVFKPGKGAKKAAKAGARIALVSTVLTIALAGGIAFFVNRTVSDTTSQVQKQVSEAQDRASKLQSEAQERIKKAREEAEARRADAEGRRSLAGGPARPPRAPAGEPGLRLESDVPLAADVNGDGVPDALVRARAGSERVIVALSGKDLKPLWQTPSSADKIRVAGDRVLAIRGNEVVALALADGKQQWKRQASDRITDAARRGSTIVIESADDALVSLAAADGATLPGKPAKLDLIGEDDSQRIFGNLGLTHASLGKFGKQLRPDRWFCPTGETQAGKTVRRQQGFITSTTTTYGCKADVAVAYAVRSRGTRVPFLVGVHRRKGALWERGLAPEGELTVLDRAPWLAIQGDRVAAAFALRGKGADVMVVGLNDGQVAWRKPIDGGRGRVSGIAMLGERIFVNVDGRLVGLDAREGAVIQ